jgi:hypothetical protein
MLLTEVSWAVYNSILAQKFYTFRSRHVHWQYTVHRCVPACRTLINNILNLHVRCVQLSGGRGCGSELSGMKS